MSKNVTTWGYNIPKLELNGSLSQQNLDIGDSSVFQFLKNGIEKSGILVTHSPNGVNSFHYASVDNETLITALRFYINTSGNMLVSRSSITLSNTGRTIYNGDSFTFNSAN